AARGAVAEASDDAGDPLAVEVLAGDDDDAAAAEVDGGGKDAAVPERHDRLAAAVQYPLVVFGALGAPAKRRSERCDDRIAERGNQARLQAFRPRLAPVAAGHARGCSRPSTNVIRSTNCVSPPALACAPFSLIAQNGHAATTVPAAVACSCLKRTSLIRLPGSSSLSANSRPPPAPQQYGLSRLRSGSRRSAPKRVRSARGSSVLPA